MEEKVNKRPTYKRVVSVCLYVFFALFILVGASAIIFRITTRNNDGGINFGNTEYRLVVDKSMSENKRIDNKTYQDYDIQEIKVDSLLRIKRIGNDHKSFYTNLEIGDVISFKYYFSEGQYAGRQVVVVNRLVDKINDPEHAGEFILKCAGDIESVLDNKNVKTIRTYEEKSSRNYVLGIVKHVNLSMGKILTFLISNVGIIAVIITPSAIFFVYEIYHIFMILRRDRLEKEAISNKEKNDEIASLKKQIEELQKDKEDKK